jgi:hypothetical protein
MENFPETQDRVRPEPGAERAPTSLMGGADINAQLAQARELEAKLAEEYRAVRLLCASIAGEASDRGERVCELGKQSRERIDIDFNVDDPNTPPHASQKLVAAATLLRAMPALSSPEARNLHREAQALIEQADVQQAESSASRMCQPGNVQDDGDARGREASAHTDGEAGQTANQGRTPVKERILDTRGQAQDGDARNVINARWAGNAEMRAVVGYYPRRGGRYDSCEDRSPKPEPPGTRVFSREIRTMSFPHRFRQPTSTDKYMGETDPRVWLNDYRLACQLGGATTDEVIILNLLLHLADSVRTRLSPWTRSQLPARRTGETSTSPGWIEESVPRTDPRPDASPGWLDRSPSWAANYTSAPRQASCSDVCPSPRGASSSGTSTRACADTMWRCTLS